MQKVYKKKPEFLHGVYFDGTSESAKEVYYMLGSDKLEISFEDGSMVITSSEHNLKVSPGDVLFCDEKNKKFVSLPESKILNFYDDYTDKQNTSSDDSE